MTIYLSGKITGTDDYEKRFKYAEKKLKKKYPDAEIVNPVEYCKNLEDAIDKPKWEYYMRYCIFMLAGACDAVYMLDGWRESRGARLEYLVATSLNYKVLRM